MKKFFSIFAAAILFTNVFAHGGLMSGEKDLRVTKTKWFDIIYPARSEQAAALLYENADNIYEEIGQQYGFPPKFRLPVVICPGVEVYNGYFTNGPYNHIVLYDTAMIEDLAVFSETFLSLFRHECIHAYTFNLKNDFWTTVSNIFGDPISLQGLFVSSGLAEGATVSGESATGEGRINDQYAMQMVKQAKIESKFPDYWDAQGASNAYPRGSFYYFNGTFNEWLQKKYGMEKYAKFWYKCINIQALTTGRAFKKVYGISITKAWEMYRKEYPVPSVPENPVYASQVQDFFVPNASDYSGLNNQGSLFTSLTVSPKGIAYMDSTCSKVFFVPAQDLTKDEIKPVKLFTSTTATSIKFSKDGRYLAVESYDYSKSNYRVITKIYDMETKTFTTVNDHGFYSPSIIKADDGYYLVRQSFTTPNYGIQIDKLNLQGDGEVTTLYSTYDYVLNETPFCFTDLGNGTFAYIRKAGLVYSIEIMDLQCTVLKKYELPVERMVVRYLSYTDDDTLLFSWAAPGTMPRLGQLSLSTGTFSLQQEDLAGGVYYPVNLEGQSDIAYIGQFYRENRLFTAEIQLESVETAQAVAEAQAADEVQDAADGDGTAGGEGETATLEGEAAVGDEVAEMPQLPFGSYNQFKYYTKGYWFPVSLMTTNSYTPDYTASYPMDMGVTYYTSNPWTNDNITVSAGYADTPRTGALSLEYSGTNGIETVGYGASSQLEFNPHGWKKLNGTANLTGQIPFNNGWFLGQLSTQAVFGKADLYVNTSAETDDLAELFARKNAVSSDRTNYLLWDTGVLFGYSHVLLTGPGKWEHSGFAITDTIYYELFSNTTTGENYFSGMDMQITARTYIPKLLPLHCPFGLCYNLPSQLYVYLFPAGVQSAMNPNYNYAWAVKQFHTSYALASARFDTLLFGMDVQKATPIKWLFLNDLQISLSYAGIIVENSTKYTDWRFAKIPEYIEKAKNGGLRYEDYLCLRVAVDITPNIGSMSNLGTYSFYTEVGTTGIAGTHKAPYPVISVGLGASLF